MHPLTCAFPNCVNCEFPKLNSFWKREQFFFSTIRSSYNIYALKRMWHSTVEFISFFLFSLQHWSIFLWSSSSLTEAIPVVIFFLSRGLHPLPLVRKYPRRKDKCKRMFLDLGCCARSGGQQCALSNCRTLKSLEKPCKNLKNIGDPWIPLLSLAQNWYYLFQLC